MLDCVSLFYMDSRQEFPGIRQALEGFAHYEDAIFAH